MPADPSTESPSDQQGPAFTVFIPTYNRARTLGRALESVAAQSFRDFEVLIVDDGSTDDTPDLVRTWQRKADFPIVYHRQENQGKHGAHNTALGLARGEFFVILDSDDKLAPDALTILKRHWDAIPNDEKPGFAGVEGLCAFMDSGKVAGSRFPRDVMDSDYIETRNRYGVGGDKKNAIRTEVMRRYPFPRFAGERHIRDSLLWKRMAREYKTRYINEIIEYIEYQSDGLSASIFALRMRNPQGFAYYYREQANVFGRQEPLGARLDAVRRYVRYSLHARVPPSRQYSQIDATGLFLLAFPLGLVDWLGDRLRMRVKGLKARP